MATASNSRLMAEMVRMNNIYYIKNDSSIMPWMGFDGGDGEPTAIDEKNALEIMTAIKKSVVAVKERPNVDRGHIATLKELGFKTVANKAHSLAETRMKENMAALAGYTKITKEDYKKADEGLRARTKGTCRLALTDVSDYPAAPPNEVLGEMKKAHQSGIFDKFQIIHVQKVPDPILVGRIKNCEDLFFIAEWDKDISLQELVG
jgi:hypothetical protein